MQIIAERGRYPQDDTSGNDDTISENQIDMGTILRRCYIFVFQYAGPLFFSVEISYDNSF